MSINEDEELALALELSARAERERVETLISHDAALGRAIKDSLREAEANTRHPTPQPSEAIIDGEHNHAPSTESRDTHPYRPKQASRFPTFVHGDRSKSSAPSTNAHQREDEGLGGRSTSVTRSNANADSRTSDDLPPYDEIVRGNNNGTWIASLLRCEP